MAAVPVTSEVRLGLAKTDEQLITGVIAGAGTVTVEHSLVTGSVIAVFITAIAASGTVTHNLVSTSATNVIVEFSAACSFQILVRSDGPHARLKG